MESSSPQGVAKTSALAVAAFVLGILGLCLIPLNLVALIMGIVAMVKTNKNPLLKGQGLAIAATVLGGMGVLSAGILAAVAIPAFMKFKERAKTAEAYNSLRAIAEGARAYHEMREGLPPGTSWTPDTMPCGEAAAGAAQRWDQGWRDLGFAPTEKVWFQYRYVPQGSSFKVEAQSDLRCGGRIHYLSLTAEVGPEGVSLGQVEERTLDRPVP